MNERIASLLSLHPDRPIVIGHRGLAWSYPENTLASFDAAISAGADLIELDFQTTADDQLVCIHDSKLRRYLDPSQHAELLDPPIGSLTWERIRSLDVGSWKSPQHAGATIPTLVEALDHCLHAVWLIERKTGTPEQTLAAIDRTNARDRVIVQAFDWDYLAALHALAPALPLVALGGGATGDRLTKLRATGARGVHWNDQLTLADVKSIHASRLPVWVYTLNGELTWRGALSLRIDGVATDRADAVRAFLHDRCRDAIGD